MFRLTVILGMLFGLAACGGGGGGGSGIDPRLARLDLYEAQNVRVLGDMGAGTPGMANTTQDNMPAGGTMALAGAGTLRVETGGDPLVLFGDAQLQIDFDQTSATGNMTNTFGTSSAGSVVDYAGAISLQGASVGQDMTLVYQGTLAASGDSLDLDGVLDATWLGNPASALSAADLEAAVIHDGGQRDATFILVLETVAAP